jgi:uncharacterized membrane protein YecN with MAPEG domain
MSRTAVVYLLHFEEPIGDRSRPRMWAQHYVGSYLTDARLTHHRNGTSGVPIVDEFYRRGIKFKVARITPGGKLLERRIKRNGHFSEYCPHCVAVPRNGIWGELTCIPC